MGKNPLGDGERPKFERSSWTPQQHCDHANRQLIEKGINDDRRHKGLGPVRWIIADGRVVIANGEPSTFTRQQIADERMNQARIA